MLDASVFQLLSIIICVTIVVGKTKRGEPFLPDNLLFLFLFAYAVLLISLNLFPIPVQREIIASLKEVQGRSVIFNYVPLKDVFQALSEGIASHRVTMIIGKIVLFIPMGMLLPLRFTKLSSFSRVIATGFVISLLIESFRLCLSLIVGPYKVVNIDNIILNTLGTAIGFSLLKLSLFVYPTLHRLLVPKGDTP